MSDIWQEEVAPFGEDDDPSEYSEFTFRIYKDEGLADIFEYCEYQFNDPGTLAKYFLLQAADKKLQMMRMFTARQRRAFKDPNFFSTNENGDPMTEEDYIKHYSE